MLYFYGSKGPKYIIKSHLKSHHNVAVFNRITWSSWAVYHFLLMKIWFKGPVTVFLMSSILFIFRGWDLNFAPRRGRGVLKVLRISFSWEVTNGFFTILRLQNNRCNTHSFFFFFSFSLNACRLPSRWNSDTAWPWILTSRLRLTCGLQPRWRAFDKLFCFCSF